MASRHNHEDIFTFEGKTLNRAQWARDFGTTSEVLCDFLDEHEAKGMSRLNALKLFAKNPPKPRLSEVIEANGERRTRKEWADSIGLSRAGFDETLSKRISRGMSKSEALESYLNGELPPKIVSVKPPKVYIPKPKVLRGIMVDGVLLTRKEIAQRIGIKYGAFCERLRQLKLKGLSDEEAVKVIQADPNPSTGVPHELITVGNESKTVPEWAECFGISTKRLYSRISEAKKEGITKAELIADIAQNGITRKNNKNKALPKIEVDGVSKSIDEWAEHLNVSVKSLSAYFSRSKNNGLSRADTIRQILEKRQEELASVEVNGERLTMFQWAKRLNMPYSQFSARMNTRLNCGLSKPEAIKHLLTGKRYRKTGGAPYGNAEVFEINGERKTIRQWAEFLGKKPETLSINILYRTKKGMTKAEALADVINNGDRRRVGGKAKIIEINGESKNLRGWARRVGVSYETLRQRLNKARQEGLSEPDAIKQMLNPSPEAHP